MNSTTKKLTVAELCKLNDLSIAQAEKALANLQEKGLVSGFVQGNLQARITITTDADKYDGVVPPNTTTTTISTPALVVSGSITCAKLPSCVLVSRPRFTLADAKSTRAPTDQGNDS